MILFDGCLFESGEKALPVIKVPKIAAIVSIRLPTRIGITDDLDNSSFLVIECANFNANDFSFKLSTVCSLSEKQEFRWSILFQIRLKRFVKLRFGLTHLTFSTYSSSKPLNAANNVLILPPKDLTSIW